MSEGPKKHRSPWTESDDNRLSFNWGSLNADTIARRLGRSVNSVIWRAKVLELGSSYRGRISIGELAEETGFHRDRVINAAKKLDIHIPRSPGHTRKRSSKGRRTALESDAADRIREFLRTYPDGAQIVQHPASEWGVSGRPMGCVECESTELRHHARGMCQKCYKRANHKSKNKKSGYADMLSTAMNTATNGHECT